MYLRFGSNGLKVKELQRALKIKADGIFGRMTEAAVKNWQNKNGRHPDGVASPEILVILLDDEISTDGSERFNREAGITIDKYYLPKDEYVSNNPAPKKEYIFLHHTAGGHNPYATIDMWARDDRGRIGTKYVIGGISPNGNDEYDGIIVDCIPDDDWAFHLGRVDRYMHSHSIGIEICCRGWLMRKNNKYIDYYGKRIPKEHVCELKFEFRGYKYFYNYSDAQIEALKKLIPYLGEKYNIDLSKGLKQWLKVLSPNQALDFFNDAIDGKVRGILSHTNVRKDKTDIYPHPKILKLIKNL